MYLFWWLVSFIPEPDIDEHVRVEDGEVVQDRVPHHPIVYVLPALEALGGVALLVASVFVVGELSLLVLLLGLFMVGLAGSMAVTDHMDRFVVTNQRVFRVSGVLTRKRATMPISRILDITVDKPLMGRLLGFGHLVFESAAQEQGLREIRYVARPDERDRTIQGVVQRSGLRGPRPQT